MPISKAVGVLYLRKTLLRSGILSESRRMRERRILLKPPEKALSRRGRKSG